MNNLNSVLIEGKIISVAEEKDYLTIESKRYDKNGNTTDILRSVVAIGHFSKNWKSSSIEKIQDGKVIRVVGRLSFFVAQNSIGIHADHIEFRPNNK